MGPDDDEDDRIVIGVDVREYKMCDRKCDKTKSHIIMSEVIQNRIHLGEVI